MIRFEGFSNLNNSLFIYYKNIMVLNLNEFEGVRIHFAFSMTFLWAPRFVIQYMSIVFKAQVRTHLRSPKPGFCFRSMRFG